MDDVLRRNMRENVWFLLDRIRVLETTLARVQTALSQTSPVLWKSLKAEVDAALDRGGEHG